MLNLYKMPEYTFPAGFLWGSATAGHQIEGNNIHSRYWKQELEIKTPGYEVSGMACNSWELYKEDIRILKELKHQAYRFSIEWSRIEPAQGVHDEEALNRYLEQLRLLIPMSPCGTLPILCGLKSWGDLAKRKILTTSAAMWRTLCRRSPI